MSDVEETDFELKEAERTGELAPSQTVGTVGSEEPCRDDGVSGECPDTRRHPGRIAAVLAGIVLLAVLGGWMAWASGFFAGPGESPAEQPSVAEKRDSGVSIAVEAEGWTDELAPFGFAAVDEAGEVAKAGEVAPGKDVSLELDDGVYALSITSIPTASDGKTTWSVPASQMVMIEDGKAAPSEVSFELLPVDPADEAAVESVTAALPEAEREAARQHLASKREDPSSDKVAAAPARPVAPEAGSGKPSRKWGIVKEAWDEKVLVSAAWDETVVVKPAWTENKLVKEAWTETVNHPAEYRTEKVKVGVKHICRDCNYSTTSDYDIDNHAASTGHVIRTVPIYEERQVLVKDAWTEKVDHPAEYQVVEHPAQTKSVHHDAVYKTVHHDAVWGWI